MLALLALYMLIVFRGLAISLAAPSMFGRLLAGTISLTFFLYVFVFVLICLVYVGVVCFFFLFMLRGPPRSPLVPSSAVSDVYNRRVRYFTL